MTQDSTIHYGRGGITFAGPDAVAFYRAAVLVSGLRMYAKHKMQPNRAWTPTVMLTMAEGITRKTYKRGQYVQAADDVETLGARDEGGAAGHHGLNGGDDDLQGTGSGH